jgi:hypothetical protein
LSRLGKICQDLSRFGRFVKIIGALSTIAEGAYVFITRRRMFSSGFQWLIVANDPEKTFKEAADHIIYWIIYRPIRKTNKQPSLLWQHSSVTGAVASYWYLKSVN